jgi:ribonuclease HII
VKNKTHYIAGVDEAGRGPLAGPVAVGVAVVPQGFDWRQMPGVGDSKKVSPENREAIFRRASALRRTGALDFRVALISHTVIDRIGITHAVERGIAQCFKRLPLDPATTFVRLDGLLKAPVDFKQQKTIIKGDAKEKIIGLASICAKVMRDTYMVRAAQKYSKYGFEIHKGYGTMSHRTALQKHGLSAIHRRSFCKKFGQ